MKKKSIKKSYYFTKEKEVKKGTKDEITSNIKSNLNDINLDEIEKRIDELIGKKFNK